MDLMEFSMSEGNDTLTGDENFLPPKLMQTPVVVNSILKPSTKGNLMQLHTPKPQQKHLKVKFETPRPVKEVTPTRYEQIADLDEKENWIERTTIVTKTDHLLNIECAKGIVNNIVENLPLSKSESVAESDKPTTESEEEEEAFFDASEETDKATPDTLGHPTPTPTSADTFPAPQDTAVSAKQQVTDVSTVSVPQGATGILEVSMECTEEDVLATEEPMDCDETAMEIDVTVISNKTLIEDKATSPKTAQVNPVTVVTSPPLPSCGGAYKIDYDNLDSFNPFQTKGDISNSPVRTTEAHNKSAAGEKIDTEQVPLNTDTVESVSDSQAPEGVLGIEAEVVTDLLSEVLPEVDGDQVQGIYNINFDDKTDPFATKSQVQNSPSSVDTFAAKSQVQNSPLAADPFATKSQVQNSPAVDLFATKSQVQNSPPAADPFATKSQIQNSPSAADPFATKSQIQNSPSAADPFATKSQIQNSPPAADPIATKSQVQNSPLAADPFATNSQVQNSPLAADPFATNSQIQNSPPAADPFATKSQVQNSPPSADQFATKSQVQNSPPSANPLVTKLQAHNNDMSTDIATVCDTQSLPVNGDITTPQRPMKIDKDDPFSTKSKVANSPLQASVLNNSNPFATKSNVCNSPIQPPNEEKMTLTVPTVPDSSTLNSYNPVASLTSEGSVITPKKSLSIEEDTLSVQSKMANSPPSKNPAPATETALVLENDPFTTKSKVPNSPAPSATVKIDALTDLDPFTTKSKVPNSPPPSVTSTEDPLIDPFTTKSKVPNSPISSETVKKDSMEDLDSFTTKSKVPNSPISSETVKKDSMEDLDPFNTKSKVPNSLPPSALSKEEPSSDPFTTKSKVPNSPISSETVKKDFMEDLDPFNTKSKVPNSPSPSVLSKEEPMSDPFTTKSKVPNSPISSETVKKDFMEDLDPFNTKSKVPNSPSPSALSKEEPMSDPFTTKSKVPNFPISSETVKKDFMEDLDTFNTKSKVPNSLPPSALSKEEPSSDPFTTKSKVPNFPISSETVKKDFMEDLDPFNTKSKVPNSPPPSALSKEEPMSDPFTTKSKVPNSPISAATMKKDPLADLNPFTTKSKVPTSPSPQAPTEIRVSDSTAATSKVPEMTSQTKQQVNPPPSLENKFPEAAFQNIASRNTLPESASNVPDFSDEEFRPATDCIFNDSSFLDVLEKFGSSNSESKMSDLSRMSLYVKFDPLVNLPASDPRRASMNLYKRASIMNMPRKSLSGKSLSEVCNAEESMLLMGTPPKQMSQRLTNVASRIHHTGFTPGSTPTTPKAFKPQLDLLCANTPPRSVKKSTTPAPVKVNSNLPEDPSDNLAASTDDNIIEVLQYTDKDMCEVKSSLFLEFQGQKLLLEREWTKVVDKLKAKIEEQNRTLAKKQADIELMGNISKELEIVVEGLIQEKEKEKDLTVELKKDREQAVQDTQSLEKAFSELHRRNEKLKETLSGHVKNQETLTAHAKELQKSLTAVKTESKEKIVELTQQLSKVKSDLSLITTSSEARTKRDKMQIESLQKTVDQKMSENKELAQMCDELLAKVSK
ncbi:transforming acidic coiled-coil-containing protein 3-like [Mizuhopecten yessoensis]|uniref:Transforming acidic coiled-coil-containing protein 3 n=1 Tax=Mizuhopecten yessoensis TaxID=6573 RepID=A0A210PHZ9_MIZYE|nr:transforming acidic coiled-coil-containing protein 3-like [Mizuhopecten yessoensis]OWF36112.1 Transforming acidic coiled-coil-containing protein 3 [Mizuhopecten yessoensis]